MDWKVRVVVVLVVASVIMSVIWLHYPEEEEEPPIRIGVIIPLTGIYSFRSIAGDGMKMAVDEINDNGGVHGRRIELVIEDSKSDPEEGVKAFERIEAKAEPVAYISLLSVVTEAIAPLAEDIGVVMVGLHVQKEDISMDRDWVYRISIDATDQADSLASILETQFVQDPAIVYFSGSPWSNIAHMVMEIIEDRGGNCTDVPFDESSPVYSAIIRNVTSSEAIVTIGLPHQVEGLVVAADEADFTGLIVTPTTGATPDMVANDAFEGVYMLAPLIYNPFYEFANKVKNRFNKTFSYTMTHQTAGGYDVMNIIANLLIKDGVDRVSLRESFGLGFHHSGILGSLKLPECCDAIAIPLYQVRVTGGVLEYL